MTSEEPIAELKKQGFAEHMQSLGYAVLAVDLRGHGVQRPQTAHAEGPDVDDRLTSRAAYQFLVDRQNRGKLNPAKLGASGIGEGANLVAAWANTPGGAVSGARENQRPGSDGAGQSPGRRFRLRPPAGRWALLAPRSRSC